MINTIQINGVHTKLTEDLELYVQHKIGPLDRFIPRKWRQSIMADVKLKDLNAKSKGKDKYTCEVIIKLPHDKITVHNEAESFPASIDLCENKLKIQLKKYRDKHAGPRLHRRIAHRLKHFPGQKQQI